MRRYLRGEIYYANLDPVFGSEQSGFRPVLIIQNDIGNRYSPTVIVAPVTSKPDVKTKLPTHCCLDLKNCLNEPSVVLLEQLRTLDKRRLKKYIGKLKNLYLQMQTSEPLFLKPTKPGSEEISVPDMLSHNGFQVIYL